MPTILDHLFFLTLLAVVPLIGLVYYRKLQARVIRGESIDRGELYRSTIIEQWVLAAICIGIWLFYARSWPLLGFSLDLTWRFWLGLAIAAVIIGYFLSTCLRAGQFSQQQRDKVLKAIDQHQLQALLPCEKHELRWYYALSVTAGIVEEMLWRGFMWWYLTLWLPLWAATIIAIAAFGIAHVYQGMAGAVRTAAMGTLLLGLYLLTGSLWVPMLVHALADILQGRMLYTVLQQGQGGRPQAQPDVAAT